ncbi:MAG: DUF5677 domain-containing protein [Deltaproteobacteria bacterium]|nr:DUF5677 domain-containing protein [Deltaproteobacteria bacterium]
METATDQLIQILITEESEAKEMISKINAREIVFLFQVLASIRLSLEKHVNAMRADQSVSSAVAAFLFCKVIRTCRAARILCSTGWGVEAKLLLRSGLEALINLFYITQKDSEERAILYSEFGHMLDVASAARVDRWPDQFKELDLQHRRNEIKENFERVKVNYPMKDFWAGKLIQNGRFREMAQQVGMQWYYDFIYWIASNHVHANVRSANEVMHVSADGKFHFNIGPSKVNTQHALLLATDFLIRAYQCIVQFFKLPEEENIEDLIAGYAALYKNVQVT